MTQFYCVLCHAEVEIENDKDHFGRPVPAPHKAPCGKDCAVTVRNEAEGLHGFLCVACYKPPADPVVEPKKPRNPKPPKKDIKRTDVT